MLNKRLIHVEMNFKLKIEDIDKQLLKSWLLSDEEVKTEVYTKIPDHLIDEYCSTLTYIENSMPDEPGNDEVIVNRDETVGEEGVISIVIFVKGKMSGISRVFYNPENREMMYQGQIGLNRGFSGRGLGKHLLGKTYIYLTEQFQELSSMKVDTHPTNEVMIHLLKSIGYLYTHTENIYA